MIPLIADDSLETVTIGPYSLDLLGGLDQGLAAGRRVAFVGVRYRDRHDRTGLEIDRMLRL